LYFLEGVWDNEKLAVILQQKDEKLDNLKQDYEIRIKEKDKQSLPFLFSWSFLL
jgi:hypothetical protein